MWLAIEHPAVFGALIKMIYPTQTTVKIEDGRKPYQSLEELHEAMLKRGLPALKITHKINFKPLDDGEIIDVEPK